MLERLQGSFRWRPGWSSSVSSSQADDIMLKSESNVKKRPRRRKRKRLFQQDPMLACNHSSEKNQMSSSSEGGLVLLLLLSLSVLLANCLHQLPSLVCAKRSSIQLLLLLGCLSFIVTTDNFTTLGFRHQQFVQAQRMPSKSHVAPPPRPSSDHYITVKTKRGQMFQGVQLTTSGRKQTNGDNDEVVGFLGIRYASPPIKRLRFMPPTQFNYAPNQVHQASQFGPICMQRFPIDFLGPQGQTSNQRNSNSNNNNDSRYRTSQIEANTSEPLLDMQMNLMEKLMAKSLSAQLRPLIRRLIRFEQSEDCLNLNLYTPSKALHEVGSSLNWPRRPTNEQNDAKSSAKLRPVLVIIHGDSFDFGSGSSIDPQDFVRKHRLVVITFNYRLNILGFPPRLSGAASFGNLGFLDQVAVLHWIRENVASFGGSPDQVSLMGSKKGAVFVNLLMLSPLAKGLFKRALMEDGSALSPMVANQINWSAQVQMQPAPAANYMRQLATLCECPVQHLAPFASATLGPSSSGRTQVAAHQHLAQNGSSLAAQATPSSASSRQQQQQQQQNLNGQQSLAPPDESRANALMLECLRQKPTEQIMQRIPLDLLHFDWQHFHHQDDQNQPLQQPQLALAIQSRWLRPIQLLQQVLLPAKTTAAPSTMAPGENSEAQLAQKQQQTAVISNLLGQQRATVNRIQLEQLINLVQSEQLNRLEANEAQQSSIQLPSPSVQLELDQLFSALYQAPNDTLRPLFAPQLDATMIVQTDQMVAMQPSSQPPAFQQQQHNQPQQQHQQTDLASTMLSRDSPFGSRDLLIGFSYPIIGHHHHHHHHHQQQQQQQQQQQRGNNHRATTQTASDANESEHLRQLELESGQFELRPGHPMAETLAEQVESFGFSDEQAIGVINSFVKTFYRFHQQEITNSIMNHYLTGNGWRMIRRRQQNQQQHEQNFQNQQQLFVLDSLLDSFQDALINVPLIKTALIHAARQLEILANVFVGQQVEKFNQSTLVMNSAKSDEQLLANNQRDDDQLIPNLTNEKYLLDSFVSFAKNLYDNFQWPFELRQLKNNANEERVEPAAVAMLLPHSTFLYQLDASLATKLVQQTIWNLNRLRNEETKASSLSSHILQLVGQKLTKLLDQLRKPEFRHQLSLSCAFKLIEFDDGQQFQQQMEPDMDSELYLQFNNWLCENFGQLVANFVSTGNVNNNNDPRKTGDWIQANDLSQQYLRYQSKCLRQKFQDDHHSVHLNELNSLIEPNATLNEPDNDDGNFYESTKITKNWSPTLKHPVGIMENDSITTLDCKLQLNQLALRQLFAFDPHNEPVASEQQSSAKWYEDRAGDDGSSKATEIRLEQPDGRSKWKVFNVFDQQLATLLKPSSSLNTINSNEYLQMTKVVEILSQDTNGGLIAEDNPNGQTMVGQHMMTHNNQLIEPKSSISARLAFWSNFISALNCTRTQPIIPTSLFSSANSTLLNLNLVQVNCNHHQQHTSYLTSNSQAISPRVTNINSLLVALGIQIRKQLQEHFNRFQLLRSRLLQHSANSSLQNHHSLRMANVSHQQVGSLDETTNGGQQSIESQMVVAKNGSGFNEGNSDFLTVSTSNNNSEQSTIGLLLRIKTIIFGRNDQNYNQNNLKNHTTRDSLVVLIAGVLVISLTLVTASYVFLKYFNNNRKNQNGHNKDSIVVDDNNDSIEGSIMKNNGLRCPHIKLQHDDANTGIQMDTNDELQSSGLLFDNSVMQQHQQQSNSNSTSHSFSPPLLVQQSSKQLVNQSENDNCNEYPMSACWLPSTSQSSQIGKVVDQEQQLTSTGTCRMHSSPSTSSLLLLTSAIEPTNQNNDVSQQPIMMPLISYNKHQQHRPDCSFATRSNQLADIEATRFQQQKQKQQMLIQATQFDDADRATTTSGTTTITATTSETATRIASSSLNRSQNSYHIDGRSLLNNHENAKQSSVGYSKQAGSLSSKKRVKISDPLGATRSMNRKQQQYQFLSSNTEPVVNQYNSNQDVQINPNQPMLWTGQWSQESSFTIDSCGNNSNNTNLITSYCPIHRPSSSGTGGLVLENYSNENGNRLVEHHVLVSDPRDEDIHTKQTNNIGIVSHPEEYWMQQHHISDNRNNLSIGNLVTLDNAHFSQYQHDDLQQPTMTTIATTLGTLPRNYVISDAKRGKRQTS